MSEYDDNFIGTYTGKKFHYLSPKPEEIDIVDIAHALSLKCRFSGHVKVFYSVAEHSIRVSEIMPEHLKLEALLHDAAEAYMPDVPRPIKESFGLSKFEDTIQDMIFKKFGISNKSPQVKEADNILIATEARDLMANMDGWAELPEPLPGVITPMRIPADVEWYFICLFDELYH